MSLNFHYALVNCSRWICFAAWNSKHIIW